MIYYNELFSSKVCKRNLLFNLGQGHVRRGSIILNVICPLPSFVLRFMFSDEIPELGIEDLVDDFVTFFIAGI